MKKFAMISLITAAIMFVLGWGLLITGGVMGGVSLIKEFTVDNVFSLWEGFRGVLAGLPEDYIPEEVNISYNVAYPIEQGGNVSNMQICGRDEVTDLKLYLVSGELAVESCAGDYFGVEWGGVGRFQYYLEDGTLYVISTENFGDVTVYVPEDMVFESCMLAAAVGNVSVEEMKAEEVAMYIGMSDVSVDFLETGNFMMEAGKSNIEIADGEIGECAMTYDTSDIGYIGSISGNVAVMGALGNLELELWGDVEQYNYFIQSNMGNVDMPGYHVVGFIQNKTIDNGAGKDMTLTSSMGNIDVDFMAE